MITTLTWHKVEDRQPETADLPIAVLSADINEAMSFTRHCPNLHKGDLWATIITPQIDEEPPLDALHEYGHLMAIREAVIAATNGESADHARRLFNETFLKGVK
jgi:hypothetical protein